MSTAAPAKSTKVGYDVPRPQGKCAVSGRDITAGEKFVAAVRETPQGLERIDVAPECWADFDKTGLLGFWQTVMRKPEEKKKVFVDDEVLCTLFERLGEANEAAKIHFRFVLGQILMRKRMVVDETTRHDDGRDVWVVRMKGKEQRLDL